MPKHFVSEIPPNYWPKERRSVRNWLYVWLLVGLASSITAGEGIRQEKELDKNPHPAYTAYQELAGIGDELQEQANDFDWGRVPDDLAGLGDEAILLANSEAGLQLQQALTFGSELPPGADFDSLNSGQQRDALYTESALQSAQMFLEAAKKMTWAQIPESIRLRHQFADLLQAIGVLGMAAAFGLSIAAGILDYELHPRRMKQR